MRVYMKKNKGNDLQYFVKDTNGNELVFNREELIELRKCINKILAVNSKEMNNYSTAEVCEMYGKIVVDIY